MAVLLDPPSQLSLFNDRRAVLSFVSLRDPLTFSPHKLIDTHFVEQRQRRRRHRGSNAAE